MYRMYKTIHECSIKKLMKWASVWDTDSPISLFNNSALALRPNIYIYNGPEIPIYFSLYKSVKAKLICHQVHLVRYFIGFKFQYHARNVQCLSEFEWPAQFVNLWPISQSNSNPTNWFSRIFRRLPPSDAISSVIMAQTHAGWQRWIWLNVLSCHKRKIYHVIHYIWVWGLVYEYMIMGACLYGIRIKSISNVELVNSIDRMRATVRERDC